MGKENKRGEKIISKTLNDLDIRFVKKLKIKNLIDDKKKFRAPDFYLVDKGIYLEYFGDWNAKIQRERKRKADLEKKSVYDKNNVPCIYIYPNDLRNVMQVILDGVKNKGSIANKDKWPHKKTVFVDKIVEKKVVVEKPVEKKVTIVKVEKKFIEENKPEDLFVQTKKRFEFDESPKRAVDDDSSGIISKIIYLLCIIIILLFIGIAAYSFLWLNDPIIFGSLYGYFIGATILSIICAALLALQRKIFKGFILVALILLIAIVLYGLVFFNDPITRVVIIAFIVLAIVPTELYMARANQE